MREIKFRVWDIHSKVMQYVDLYWFEENQIRVIPQDISGYYWVMQFTGLLDKNGKEIYTGDIVSFKGWHGENHGEQVAKEVRFGRGEAFGSEWEHEYVGFYLYPTDNFNVLVSSEEEVEVVGNIYENPGLLTGRSYE